MAKLRCRQLIGTQNGTHLGDAGVGLEHRGQHDAAVDTQAAVLEVELGDGVVPELPDGQDGGNGVKIKPNIPGLNVPFNTDEFALIIHIVDSA